MSESQYKLRIGDEGKRVVLSNYPDLKIKYLSSRNSLCPSNYSSAVCFWEGDLEVKLEVNGITVVLNDHDKRKSRLREIISSNDIYRFRGDYPLVINRDRDQTYLVFSVQKAEAKKEKGKSPEDIDTPVSYDLNELFTVKVGENASTGYHWEFNTSEGLEIAKSQYTSHCRVGVAGCGGKRTLLLRGTKKGIQSLYLNHISPGGEVTKETMTFNIL